MPIMVRTGGNIFVPSESCDHGFTSYHSHEIGIPYQHVNTGDSLRPYLTEILKQIIDMGEDLSEITARTNLLYPDGELDVNLYDLSDSQIFEFFAGTERMEQLINNLTEKDPKTMRRFRYNNQEIEFNGSELKSNTKVKDVFPPQNKFLAIPYLITVGVQPPEGIISDDDAVHKMVTMEENIQMNTIRTVLNGIILNPGLLAAKGYGLLGHRVALAIAGSLSDGYLFSDTEEIAEAVSNDNFGCECEYDHLIETIPAVIDRLAGDDIVVDGGMGFRFCYDITTD